MVKLSGVPGQQRGIAISKGVGISPFKQGKSAGFPAFLDLVKRQRSRDYKEED